MNELPPGWHIDPGDPSSLRYWDGSVWTEHRAPRPPLPPPGAPLQAGASAPAGATVRADWFRDRLGGVFAAAALLISAFLPWATITTVFGSVSVNGMDGDGKITAGLALLLGALFVVVNNRRGYVAAMIVAAIAAAIGVIDYIDVDSRAGDLNAESDGFARVTVGVGIYGTIFGALAGFFCALGARRALGAPGRPVRDT